MELNHDWRELQAIFHPIRRAAQGANPPVGDSAAPIFVVAEDDLVVSACGDESEDSLQWAGLTLSMLATEVPNREVVIFDRKEVDQWLSGSLALPHFYDQVEYLRENAVPRADSAGKSKSVASRRACHFLLRSIQGWWGKVLPSAYGIFIRLETKPGSKPERELFVLVRRGKLELFHAPDLSGMNRDRVTQSDAVVKYLSEKHLVPVQGVTVTSEEWAEWAECATMAESWRKVAMSIQAKRAKLAPFRWQLMGLLSARAFFGI